MPPTSDVPLLDADLELLDDETRHQACSICNPDLQLGVPFLARCGRRAIGFRAHSTTPPPNACPDCLALIGKPCSRGHTR